MIRLALATVAAWAVCLGALDVAATRWAVPFAVLAAGWGVWLVLHTDVKPTNTTKGEA